MLYKNEQHIYQITHICNYFSTRYILIVLTVQMTTKIIKTDLTSKSLIFQNFTKFHNMKYFTKDLKILIKDLKYKYKLYKTFRLQSNKWCPRIVDQLLIAGLKQIQTTQILRQFFCQTSTNIRVFKLCDIFDCLDSVRLRSIEGNSYEFGS